MFKVNSQGFLTDPRDDRPVAVFVDSFRSGLGEGNQSQTVIFRLYLKDWDKNGPLVPAGQAHQFVLSADRAAELGQRLLELAAQAEKENGHTEH